MIERIFAVLTGKGRLVRMSREETGEERERNEQITFIIKNTINFQLGKLNFVIDPDNSNPH